MAKRTSTGARRVTGPTSSRCSARSCPIGLAVHDVARDLEAQGHELLLSVDRHGLAGLPTSASTANVSAVDSDGLACTITVSSGYGAGITIPGTGMILNNALGELELNRLGLHQLAPGTRLAPTWLRRPAAPRTVGSSRSAPRC